MQKIIKQVTSAIMRQNFSEFIDRVSLGKETVLVTRRNKPQCVLMPYEEYQKQQYTHLK